MAPSYDSQLEKIERFMFQDGRAWVCSRAHGRVLEVGIGTGRNIALYAADVDLVGVDLSPAMLDLSRQRAATLGRAVDLRVADAERLDFPNASFDTVVSTLVLCTIPDPARAVAEVRRVLRPGGRFVLLDHVRSPTLAVRLVQHILDPLLVRFEGDHLLREPTLLLTAAGFAIEELERRRWGIVERVSARR
jgi:SAM-dependent methyltransferase